MAEWDKFPHIISLCNGYAINQLCDIWNKTTNCIIPSILTKTKLCVLYVFNNKQSLLQLGIFFTLLPLCNILIEAVTLKYLKKDLWKFSQSFQEKNCFESLFNPFVPNASFLYPLETSENHKLMFSGVRERVHRERMGQ